MKEKSDSKFHGRLRQLFYFVFFISYSLFHSGLFTHLIRIPVPRIDPIGDHQFFCCC